MSATPALAPPLDATRDAVLAFLAAERGLDLHDYRKELIEARLLQWISATKCRTAAECLRLLLSDPAQVDRLIEALLVKVTGFFRDQPAFAALQSHLPGLVGSLAPGEPLRAWSAGAATGEEAYSLAMLLDEACASRPGTAWEVLATDVDAAAVERGRAGRYGVSAVASVPPGLAARYLRSHGDGVRVASQIRERVHFACHDLVGRRLAPPEALVASFDVVLCRNVLIYFTRRLQDKAVERFAAALRGGGLLMLGPAESLFARTAGRFTAVDAEGKLFRREEDAA